MPQWLIGVLATVSIMGIGAIGGGLIAYVRFRGTDEEWKRSVDRRLGDHEQRIRKTEEKRITSDNLDELRLSLMASMDLRHAELTRDIGGIQADVRLLTNHLLGAK